MFFSLYEIKAQNFIESIASDKLTIESVAYKAYSTAFDASAKTIEKAWWRHIREFGRPLNMRSYYIITIPAELNDGTVATELFSRVLATKTGSRFYLALNTKDIPAEKVAGYNKEIESIIQTFKKSYYITLFENQLAKEEKQAVRTSKKVSKAKGKQREKALEELEQIDANKEAIQVKLKEVYKAYQ
jgi:DNA-directed RNA polymerase subunit F